MSFGARNAFRARIMSAAAASPKLAGSGTAFCSGSTLVWREELVTKVVPLRLTSVVNANPLGSLVNFGTVPAASENMLKANVLPDVDVPSAELKPVPQRL